MRRQTNQHFDLFDRRKSFRTNAVTPNVIFGPIWLHDDQPSSMEIIELNSSNEVESSPRETKEANRSNNNINHAWSYVNNDDIEQIEDSYKINKKARERRRLENENNFSTMPATYASPDAIDFNSHSAKSSYPNQSNNDIDERLKFNHQMDRFTIVNKNFIDSDTSTEDDYGDVNIMTSDDLIMNRADWEPRDFYNEEIITYDTDLDQETRTIWIYSYKNKHLLSEDEDFETVNIPSKDMSSSSTTYSSDSSGEHPKERSTPSCRIGSPIPTYIPKLDLSLVPTLSTVTEMTERNIHTTTPNESSPSSNEKLKKPCNNWFISESAKLPGVKSARKHEKSTNIINWMALSPREKRRVLVDKSFSDMWVESHLNLAEIDADNNLDNHSDRPNDAQQNDSVKVIVDVVVHVDVNEKSENTTVEELKSAGASLRSNVDETPTIHQIKYADATCEEFQDRGDHYTNFVVAPAIRLSPKNLKRFEITDPIEKLENSNWIRETKDEKETAVYDYVLGKSESISDDKNDNNTVDQVWMKNTIPFLKPSEWNAFLPITETPVSYHLSLGSIIEERKTWYKRLMNFLNCCK